MPPKKTLERKQIDAIAKAAKCDPRTVQRALAGKRTVGDTSRRLRRVMVTFGMGPKVLG